MDKPINVHFNKDQRTSTLFFENGDAGNYAVKGAVCWPRRYDEGASKIVGGYALLGCQDIATGIIWIMEERAFQVIDHIVEDGKIAYEGLAPWFNKNWTRYYARKYFFQDEYELGRQYRLNISRSSMIEPKPEMIEIATTRYADMTHLIWKYVNLKQIRIEKDGYLHKNVRALKEDDKAETPALYALQLLLFGFERYPYKERKAA